jgi:hypothetical protein
VIGLSSQLCSVSQSASVSREMKKGADKQFRPVIGEAQQSHVDLAADRPRDAFDDQMCGCYPLQILMAMGFRLEPPGDSWC